MEKYSTEITYKEQIEKVHDFYNYVLIKENDKKNLKLNITKPQFIRLLERLNFCKYYINGRNASYIYIKDNRAVPVTDDVIFSELVNYIKNLPLRQVSISMDAETIITFDIDSQKIIDALINNSSNLSNKVTFYFLPSISDFEFQKDTALEKYFYFNNTVVRLQKKSKPETLEYNNLIKKVWENNIINRDFNFETSRGDFELFFEKITGNDAERKKSLMSMIGYLLHNYFDYDLFAIYVTDVNIEFSERAGGTGKGIISKALRQMCNRDVNKDTTLVKIDGVDFDKTNERRYSDVDVNTQIINIDDLPKKIKPDTFITDISEGVGVRKMYADKFSQQVKFYISTNYAPNFDNPSDRRRAKIFELSNYYSDVLRPSDEFKWFFGNEWTSTDWNEFYSFMIRCADEYMQNGVTEVSEVNYSDRVVMENTCEDFVFWFEEQIAPYTEKRMMGMFEKREFYSRYTAKYSETLAVYKKPVNYFWDWVRLYCRKKSFPYSEFRSTVDEFYIFPDSLTMQKCKNQRKKK